MEAKLFTRLLQQYLSDDQYAALQLFLIANPEAYAKNVREQIPAHVLKKIKEEIDG